MSRRLLFLLAVAVVVMYFSIILYILTPMHSARGGVYPHLYHMSQRRVTNLWWCRELRWVTPPSPRSVALVSYPGSGNTWLRYLLQQATGILTGSIYMDYGLRINGFPAENVSDGSVLVAKTHENPPVESTNRFQAAVLLIRSPRDAILAEFNRLFKGHLGSVSKSAFRISNTPRRPDWPGYVSSKVPLWVELHTRWLTDYPGPVHVVSYERLVVDTRNTLDGVLRFLNQTVTESQMECAMMYKEGIYRRKKKHQGFDPFTEHMYAALRSAQVKVNQLVLDYYSKGRTRA